MQDFLFFLNESAKDIDQKLEEIFKSWREDVGHLNSHILKLLDLSIDSSRGGKRLRGSLVILGFLLSGQKKNPQILIPACSYEIFQTAILAHDDIIDKSPTRRGKATIYQSLGADHYAISQTICLGDIGFFLAFQLLASSDFPDKEKNLALKQFSKMMIDTAFGEILDVELPHLKTKFKEEDIITISKFKTAWYTIVGPLQLGASLGGADQKLLDSIKEFGENLGIAFQIQDDILGVFGSEEIIGKSTTSDIEEGKLTLLFLEALKNASEKEKQILKKYYGKKNISFKEAEQIRQIFKQTRALDKALTKAVEYVNQAKKVIPSLTSNKEMEKMLNQMADFLVERKK